MYRFLGVFMVMILLVSGIQAQQTDCVQIAANVDAILQQAQMLLEQGNTIGANTLLTVARDTLAECSEVTPESTIATTQPTETSVPQAISPTLPPTATALPTTAISSGNFTVNAPDVNLDQGIAFVYFANASIDVGSIDLYLDNEPTPIVANLSFGEVTGMVMLRSGGRVITARPTGTGINGEQLYRTNWNYLSNSTWVVVAAGIQDEFAFIVEPISVLRNDYEQQARVRVINLIPGVTRMTVTDNTGRVYGDRLGWVGLRDTLVPPGTYTLSITTVDNRETSTDTYTFEVNTTTTLLATGRGTAEQPIQFMAFEAQQELTRVRFINNTGLPIEIYKRPGNELLIELLDPGAQTDFLEFASGATTFVGFEPGVGPRGRELSGLPWQLRPGRDMTVSVEPGSMRVLDISLRTIP